MANTQVNIYRSGGAWYFSAWVDDEYDTNDVLEADSETDARAEALALYPGATVKRVADVEATS